MDGTRFDAFARTLGSRRTALGGLLGGVTALLGFVPPEGADAHDFLARCRQIPDPRRRRVCIRRARAHRRAHARSCRPLRPAVACRGRCGEVRDGCGDVISCSCPTGELCVGARSTGSCCPRARFCLAIGRGPTYCCAAGTICVNPGQGGRCCPPEQPCTNSHNECCAPPNTCIDGDCTPP